MRSKSQAPSASILVCSVACSAEQRVEVGVGIGETRAHLVESRQQVALFGDPVHNVADNVLGRVELGLLWQVPDAKTRGEARLAGEAVIETGHDAQK